jgi:hypothetical protein
MVKPRSVLRSTIALLLVGCAVIPVGAFAQTGPAGPSSGELVETPREFDGETIEFTGEVIGEVMVRGEYAWIHLNDDAYMLRNVEEGAELGGYNTGMPIWLPANEAENIVFVGGYKYQGDIAEVTGTFNAACSQHGGDMDIHATSLKVVTPGRRALDPVHPWKIVLALGLALTAAGLWFADRRARRLESKGLQRRR